MMLTALALLISSLSPAFISALPIVDTADSAALNLTTLVTTGVAYKGIATRYTDGWGACGWDSSPGDPIVALGVSSWDGGSHCGQWITMTNTDNNKVNYAMVADMCPGCTTNGIDLPDSYWYYMGGQDSVGHFDVSWVLEPFGFSPPGATISDSTLRPNANGNMCLTATSGSNGAEVTITTCNGGTGQRWQWSDGQLHTLGASNMCLDVTSGSTANGNFLQVWTCGAIGNANQNFAITSDNRITWGSTGECVDLTNGSTASGNRIQMWDCSSGNNNQVWNRV